MGKKKRTVYQVVKKCRQVVKMKYGSISKHVINVRFHNLAIWAFKCGEELDQKLITGLGPENC